jgi:hypothetical protein
MEELIYFVSVIKKKKDKWIGKWRNDREWENWLWPQGWVENVDDTCSTEKTI